MADISTQLIEQVQQARQEQTPLNIIGRNSKSFYGRQARGAPFNIANHTGVVEYQPQELVLTARAGTPLSEIDAVLAEQGQMLSFEPPSFTGDASIGGTLACNQSGPARPFAGSVRDMVLGLRLINGRGEYLRFGGQVMKNVAGYDVSRLQAGAMGCLGVITEVSLKVMPRPAQTATVICKLESASEAIELMNRLQGRPVPLSGACWLQGRLYLRLAGAESAVMAASNKLITEHDASELEQQDEFWTDLKNHRLKFFEGDSPLWRLSVATTLSMSCNSEQCLIDWGGAQRWLRGVYDREQLSVNIPDAKGEVHLFRHGDRETEVFHPLPVPLQQLHTRLKAAFDPQGLFNPGRLYAWL